ncbi:MAG: hypothetical protein LBS21_05470 [Clostridiales bacterium]|jgi:hypothetical protein|nr:hypothetical protein [Clostridiales bacterium]
MDNFLNQVERLLHEKTVRELKSIITSLAEKAPISSHQIFLSLLENKSLQINASDGDKVNSADILSRIKKLYEKTPDYDIEVVYDYDDYDDYNHYDGWDDYGDEDYIVKNDDGFADEFLYCYNAAEILLAKGSFNEAAEAFRILFDTIEVFDECNEVQDFGEFSFEYMVDCGALKLDLKRAKALRGYSALMSENRDLVTELTFIYTLCGTFEPLMFKEILEAGSVPVPGKEEVIAAWVTVLKAQNPVKASPFVKEAAEISGNNEIMEDYARTAGKAEPVVYLDLCELLAQRDAPIEKVIQTAYDGLENTDIYAGRRDKLASLLADTATKAGDTDMYTYAVSQRFYSTANFDNYLAVYKLDDKELNEKALSVLDLKRKKSIEPFRKDSDFYIIHMLNRNYDMVFDELKKDTESLGWSYSLKGTLFPFFLGLIVNFSDKALMTQRLVNSSVNTSEPDVYSYFRNNTGRISHEQDKRWRNWCVNEVRSRADAIVSGGHRGSYFKAAELLVALYETWLYDKQVDNESGLGEILTEYNAKYPRHRSFKSDFRDAIEKAKLTIKL